MSEPSPRRLRRLVGVVAATALTAVPLTAPLAAPAAGRSATAAAPAAAVAAARDDGRLRSQAIAAGLDPRKATRTPASGPRGANPWLALVPRPERADYAGWRRFMQSHGEAKSALRDQRVTSVEQGAVEVPPVLVDEEEPADIKGANDSFRTAQQIAGFGTGDGNPRARILGSLHNERVAMVPRVPSPEDDGSIPKARDTRVGTTSPGFRTSARIGDGPHGRAGSGSGDFDVYKVRGVAGRPVTIDIDTPTGSLDSMLLVVDSRGEFVAFNDDTNSSLDSLVRFFVPRTGDYFVFVTGFFNLPTNPFVSGSGDGAASQGPYTVKITQGGLDIDVYGVQLRVGDTLGVSQVGARLTGVLDPSGRLVHGSQQDASFIYPLDSPLPGGGAAVNDYVADDDGWHYLMVSSGSGRYDVTAEVYRPGSEGAAPTQTLFLDFDGARLNTGVFGGSGVTTLSPLRAFLGRWGLTSADYEPLARTIIDTVTENVEQELAASGVNPDFEVRILNSLDHADPWGQPGVSRVIVGGTIPESGVFTIGVAQSIDPGNFEEEESALVLLDVLSSSRADGFGDASLNFYLRPVSDRVAFVGQAVGNVTSHEAGHFFGDWHVDQFNANANLMDQGGNFRLMFGVGPDGIGGTADDRDVDFGEDVFNPNEGFTGIEDTLGRLAAALTL